MAALFTVIVSPSAVAAPPDRDGIAFFESKVRPLLVARCYKCHSSQAAKLGGGLALDSKAGWSAGGDSGPAVVPGRPEESRLIKAVQWTDDEVHMPPKQKLTDAEVALLVHWVRRGAPDPRKFPSKSSTVQSDGSWEAIFQERLKWWSLQPVASPRPPAVKRADWPRNEVDRFVLAPLEARGLSPAPEADRWTLGRRLTFALTGLPPAFQDVERFVNDRRPTAHEDFVDGLLKSPHFGERWARHWMDIVHYADTHGYEWDIPAKHAWRYRDYLIRAFNEDVPFRQIVLEHLAGDLLGSPRVNPQTGLNESLIGPLALRLGERRHGDNAEFDGITQEAMDNVIDTVSKSFLATTVACAHCHDHKLDAIAQRDYYAWSGIFMSSRWVTRTLDAADPNVATIAALRRFKGELRPALAEIWLRAIDGLEKEIEEFLSGASTGRTMALDATTSSPEKPEWVLRALRNGVSGSPRMFERWRKLVVENGPLPSNTYRMLLVQVRWKELADEYASLSQARAAANRRHVRVLADFTTGKLPEGWTIDGLGLRNGFARDGEFVVMDEGTEVVRHVLPAGLYTHLDSPRLQGALRSPMWTHGEGQISLEAVGGGFASMRPIVDHSLFPEIAKYLDWPFPTWLPMHTRVTEETKERRIYFEFVTQDLNNNFPARVGLIAKPKALADPRSWFGVTRIYAGGPPQDELKRFARLFEGAPPNSVAEAARRYRDWLRGSVERWRDGRANADDVVLVNWMLEHKLLPNDAQTSRKLSDLVARYRALQEKIKPDTTVGSIADVAEGHDERIGLRGSYNDFGEPAPRGNIRFLARLSETVAEHESGRLELAHCCASADNPLTARVYVNRVWNALFGTGLVRTLDDFGHLGEKPSHPELLDYLARRFMDEGWSTKKLIRLLVTSAAWRQSGDALPAAVAHDPENRLWHHYPLRRLEAEEIRDAVLAVSGRLDGKCFGPPIDPYRRSEDEMKRLFSGPLDGNGRRSVYVKMTLMEPPKFLAQFNQPLPKLTVGRRDVTNAPNQALALLNDPFVTGQARFWAQYVIRDRATTVGDRLDAMLSRAMGRPDQQDERARFEVFLSRVAELRGVKHDGVLQSPDVWQDVAHAIFNLKEFIYVR